MPEEGMIYVVVPLTAFQSSEFSDMLGLKNYLNQKEHGNEL